MKDILKLIGVFFIITLLGSCEPKVEREYIVEPCPEDEKPSMAAQIKQLKDDGFEIFDYVDDVTGDTLIMQQYFMAFLKSGSNKDQSTEALDSLQQLHLGHLTRMYNEGFADVSGPFGDDGDVRGITIYNVPTMEIADSLANLDPMVQAGRIAIEIRPWWAGKGYGMR